MRKYSAEGKIKTQEKFANSGKNYYFRQKELVKGKVKNNGDT